MAAVAEWAEEEVEEKRVLFCYPPLSRIHIQMSHPATFLPPFSPITPGRAGRTKKLLKPRIRELGAVSFITSSPPPPFKESGGIGRRKRGGSLAPLFRFCFHACAVV